MMQNQWQVFLQLSMLSVSIKQHCLNHGMYSPKLARYTRIYCESKVLIALLIIVIFCLLSNFVVIYEDFLLRSCPQGIGTFNQGFVNYTNPWFNNVEVISQWYSQDIDITGHSGFSGCCPKTFTVCTSCLFLQMCTCICYFVLFLKN